MLKIGKYQVRVKSRGELILPLVFSVFAILYLRETYALLSFNAMLLVRYVLFGVLLLSVIVAVKQITFSDTGLSDSKKDNMKIHFDDNARKIALFILLTALSLMMLRRVGYVITFGLYSSLMMYILGVRNIKTLVIVPICLLVFLYLLFQKWLMVPMPKGIFG